MTLPDKDTIKKGTKNKEPMILDKKQLIEITEDLEIDNLVMYSNTDGTVILI